MRISLPSVSALPADIDTPYLARASASTTPASMPSGILTAVAYQIVLGDLIPHVSYFTLIHGFLNLSFLMMCAGAAANLFVWNLDKQGNLAAGDLLDRRFRQFFPLAYLALNLLMLGVAFVLF